MRRLRDIANMRAPRITNAQLIQKNCYVYSNDSILFIIPADQILGWNGNAITIRLQGYDITYSNTGSELGIVTVSTRQ